jgi:hypothetical protein
VAAAALASIVLIWAAFLASSLFEDLPAILVPLATLPCWGPYLLVLGHLRWGKRKKALAWAVALGSTAFVMTAFLLAGQVSDRGGDSGPGAMISLGLFGLTQAALVARAIKAYRTLGWEAGDTKTLAVRVLPLLTLSVLISVAIANRLPPEMRPGVASATSWLRTINTAAVTYASTYGNGFPPSLAVLGAPAAGAPDCRKSDLVDPAMAAYGNAFVRTGYLYEYRPGPPVVERPAPGCPPGVPSYTITARPLKYGKTGSRSFFTDETAIIRGTSENRAATANDPPI